LELIYTLQQGFHPLAVLMIISSQRVVRVILIIALVTASLTAAWIGYQGWGWDDAHYVRAAKMWATSPPYVGQTHWELRLGFVLPLAAAVKLFGYNEPALVLVPVLFYLALLIVTYVFAQRLLGTARAYVSVIVVASIPLLAAWATTPRVAIAEAFYLVLSFWCVAYVSLNPHRYRLPLMVSGVALGFAWLTRESALGFGLGLFALFLLGRPIPRRHYVWLLIGAGCVLLSEMTFYELATGNPFYRLFIDLNHGTITRADGEGPAAQAIVATAAAGPNASFADTLAAIRTFFGKLAHHFDWTKIGAQTPVTLLHINNWIDPYIQFFTEPYFGLIFWLAVPSAIYLFAASRESRQVRIVVGLILVLAAGSVIASLYLLFLRPLPRYFVFTAYAAGIVVASAVVALWLRGHPRIAIVVMAALLTSDFLFMDARRGLGLYNERRLIELMLSSPGPVITDSTTADMASFLVATRPDLHEPGIGPPIPGAIYFLNPTRPRTAAEWSAIIVGVTQGYWAPVYEHVSSTKWLGSLLRGTGVSSLLPDYAVSRLARPYGSVRGYYSGWVDLDSRAVLWKTRK